MSDIEKRKKVRELWETGKIKIKGGKKSVDNTTDEFVENVLREYEEEQLRSTNEWLAKNISEKVSKLLCKYGPISKEYESELGDSIANNEFAQRDLQLIVGFITPYIPLIGLITVGLTIGEYILMSRKGKEKPEQEEVVDLD